MTKTKRYPIKKTVCVTEDDVTYWNSKYGNISEAIRHMVKGGKYEQLFNEAEALRFELKRLGR